MSEHVIFQCAPGPPEVIRECIKWLSDVDYHRTLLAESLETAFYADKLPPAARAAALDRLLKSTQDAQSYFADRRWLSAAVDANDVAPWITPYLDTLASVCADIQGVLQNDDAHAIIAVGLETWLPRLKASTQELKRLSEALAFVLPLKTRRAQMAQGNDKPDARHVEVTETPAAETGFKFERVDEVWHIQFEAAKAEIPANLKNADFYRGPQAQAPV